MRRLIFPAILWCAPFLATSTAVAEPIRITSGSGAITGASSIHEGFGQFTLAGSNLDIAVGVIMEVNFPCEIDSAGCRAGDRVNLSAPALVDISFRPNLVNGMVVNFLTGQFDFAARQSTGVRTDGPVRTPFRFTGHLTAFDGPVVSTEADLIGAGTMFATFGPIHGRNGVFLENLTFEFSPAAPTPEPATAILLTAAAIVLGRFRSLSFFDRHDA